MNVALVRVEERISDLFRIVVDALTDSPYSNPTPAIGQAASVVMTKDGQVARSFDGVISEITLMGMLTNRVWYRFILVPPLAALGLTRRSRCFLTVASAAARTTKDVLTAVLNKAVGMGASPTAAEFNLASSGYPALPSALQVDETDLDFMRRTAEAAGLGWYFKRGSKGQTICFSDTITSYPWFGSSKNLSEVRWLDDIRTIRLTKKRVTDQVRLNAWNPEAPTTDLTCTSPGPLSMDKSFIDLFEQPYTDTAVGTALAGVRKEEQTTGSTTLTGTSVVDTFSPGYVILYKGPASDFGAWRDDTFLLTEVRHIFWQSIAASDEVMAAVKVEQDPLVDAVSKDPSGYGNRFVAVSVGGGYRPARVTPKPRLDGLLRATLCDNKGAVTGSPAAPYMDKQGRYQVVLPYPAPDGSPGCLFAPLRIMSGFGGSLEVWQMPLRVGTTVYLAFEGGDIDRPIIAGVVANAAQPTPLPNTVQPSDLYTTYLQSVVKTSSGIIFKITDGTPLVLAQEVPTPPKPSPPRPMPPKPG